MAAVLTQSIIAIAPGRFGTPYAYGNGVGTFQRGQNLYIVCSNPALRQTSWDNSTPSGTPPPILAQAHVLKSTDGGATWDEVDSGNAPSVALLKNHGTPDFRGLRSPMAATYQDADTLIVAYWVWDYVYNDPVELRFSTFDLITDTWGPETAGGPTSETVLNMSVAFRSGDGATIFEYDGSETVMASSFSRVFYLIYNAGFGAETPIDVAQTGSTTNYNWAGAVAGDSDRTHLFYRTSTAPDVPGPSTLLQATLKSTDVLQAPVTITAAVDTSDDTHVPPNRAPWSTAIGRSITGTINLYIAWVKDGDLTLNYSTAVSADTPVFSDVLIGLANCVEAGIFNAGFTTTVGLIAASESPINTLTYTGSTDGTTWDAGTPLTQPDPTDPEYRNMQGLGILAGDGGYGSAGVVVNSLFTAPS